MIHEFLEAITDGGTIELINNTRTYAYAKAMGIQGVKPCGCACASKLACDPGPYTVQLEADGCLLTEAELAAIDACGDEVIAESSISSGLPWADAAHPASSKYAGLYSLGVSGWDSTFSRGVAGTSLTGTSYGAGQREGRCLTIDAILVAADLEGLEFGLSYEENKLSGLGSCGYFDIQTATGCPPEDATEAEVDAYRRYLRNVTVASGIVTVDSRVMGCCKGTKCGHFRGTAYARIQYTICTTQPWIFTEPTCCLDNATFDFSSCPLEPSPCPEPEYVTEIVDVPREQYQISITRDGRVCRIGEWDWEETQLGGGDGFVVISEATPATQTSLTEIEAEEAAADSTECLDCGINIRYDNVSGETTFETIRWELNGSEIPCDCELSIKGYYIRNKDHEPGVLNDDGSPKTYEWLYKTNSSSTDNCCAVELTFTGSNAGTWAPVAAEGSHNTTWVVDDSVDPETGELNFPPGGDCSLTAILRSGGLAVQPECPDATETTEFYIYYEPGLDGYTRLGATEPIRYDGDGRWFDAEGRSGCFPGGGCEADGGEIVLPYVPDQALVTDCQEDSEYEVFIDTTSDRWLASGWQHDQVLVFPITEGSTYVIDPLIQAQTDEDVQRELTYIIENPTCEIDEVPEYIDIFPSFTSDAWETVSIPNPDGGGVCSPFCPPQDTTGLCCEFTNPSSTYSAVASMSILAGSEDLCNFRLRAWTSPFSEEVSPCDDITFWNDKIPDFTIEVPHIPSGSTLLVNGESSKSLLSKPGGFSEPAIRYVTGRQGGPITKIDIAPCETVYLIAEADCFGTLDTKINLCFSNYYGASGSCIL